jgi:selenocysteine lyase/cysteine desulfurase
MPEGAPHFKMQSNFFEFYRQNFPVTEKYIYLDHAGVAPVSLRVREAVEPFLVESSGGGAFHYMKWLAKIAQVRKACAELINADPNDVAFVKSTSHGLSIVAEGLDWKPGDNLLIYEKEFPSNIYPWLNLKRKGVAVKTIPSRGGRILIEDIEALIDSRTRLLALSSVQFINGFRIDLKRTGELCRSRGILFCVDAIQSLGLIPMDVKAFNIPFLSADAHKWLLGPEGIGIFYCRRELAERLSPPLVGWKSVKNDLAFERPEFDLKTDAARFEEGSMNVMGIIALGAAVDLLLEIGIEKIEKRVLSLGDLIIKKAEDRGFTVLTPKERTSRGGNVTFTGNFDAVAIKSRLQDQGIMVNIRGGGLRVAPHFYNNEAEIERFFTVLDNLL